MIWMILGIFLVVAFVILLLSRVYVRLSVDYSKQKSVMIVTFRLYGIRFLRKKIDLTEWETTNKWEEQFAGKSINAIIEQLQYIIKSSLEMMHDIGVAAQTVLARLSIHQLEWHSRIGTGEADTTGIAIGGAWTIKSLLLGIMSQMSHVKCTPDVKVIPEFNRKCVFFTIDCMVSIRIGQAIHAIIKVVRKSSFRKRDTLIHEGGL